MIADYALLPNCHSGALVAPDGAVDELCVPRFDAPSVSGSLLDREAGFVRSAAAKHRFPPTDARLVEIAIGAGDAPSDDARAGDPHRV